jgi:hypothetical protein
MYASMCVGKARGSAQGPRRAGSWPWGPIELCLYVRPSGDCRAQT